MKNNSAWDAERILRTAGSYWESCTLQTGVKLEIFTEIGEGDLAAGEIAQKLDGDVRGITMLLNALTAMGLLIKKDNRYANTAEGKSLLVQQSPQYIGYLILHHSQVINSWTQLSEAVKSGEQVRRQPYNEEEERENFLMGMFNLAMANAPQIAAQIDLSKRRHLLDLGGGPGTYAIHFCLANPELRSTIFDLPTTRPFVLRTVKQFGLEERIDFMAGNYLEEEIKGSYDVAWLSHILHGEGPKDCQRIIQKTLSLMEPGGLVLIQDFILEETCDYPLFPAIFSLNMLLNTPKGQSYSETQIKEMLAKAGVKETRRIPYKGQNDAGIISGVV
ncbi:MAG: SAM-dependent methyltransferase [Deltaproteobacteria bacterium]|nr:SAM-dependent methyltransferase [Deltaproteobacteria bacterium]